jgi:alkylation response protein AidB-like acyl-CoA dehydrogenase
MPLFLNDEQVMLSDSVRPFLAKTAPVSHLRTLRDSEDPVGFSRELWKQFADMGFTSVTADIDDGGLGLGHVEAGIILEEIGYNLTPSPFLATAVGMTTALKEAGAELRDHYVTRILSGEMVAALAFDEMARHRPLRVELQASKDGNGFSLSGSKKFVPLGHVADVLLVSARTSGSRDDEHGITLFAVQSQLGGISIESTRLVDSSIAANVTFDEVHVGRESVIGEIDSGWSTLKRVLAAVRIGASSELLGVARAATDMTIGYLKERKQFGRIIGTSQALQHRAAHLYSELEVARAAVLRAQQLLDDGSTAADQAVSVAKAMAGRASSLAVRETIQMHGGIGMTDEYDAGFFMKRQRVLSEMFGDTDYHAEQIARRSGY